ncbi:ribonuclease P protein component [Leucobacter komagatae]|uniref:Ribonuclease P protein component n=1 Tax=Leucobacter komagatae TaxID=55969 RepID=A0A0D0IP31_9MICO|nr:ribonuclease P protein component [Leucobacter komagatae]
MRTGNRVGGAYCITYAVPRSAEETHERHARFGYIISKAVGNAVTRNLVRRRMKAITDELILEGTVGADIVFRALPKAAQASFAELRREMRRAVERARS